MARRLELKNWLIKLLGGYTAKEYQDTPNNREKKAIQLEREIYSQMKIDHVQLEQKYKILKADKKSLEDILKSQMHTEADTTRQNNTYK